MGEFTPSTPIQIQIRKIIFEKFNDPELRFTNDEIFDLVKKELMLIHRGRLMRWNHSSMKSVIVVW